MACLPWHLKGATIAIVDVPGKRVIEKKTPSYNLDEIKAEFCTPSRLRTTRTARDGAAKLGILLREVVEIIQGMDRKCFYKSMTSYADHTTWQDVYHVSYHHQVLYVKFTKDDEGKLLISFKDRTEK